MVTRLLFVYQNQRHTQQWVNYAQLPHKTVLPGDLSSLFALNDHLWLICIVKTSAHFFCVLIGKFWFYSLTFKLNKTIVLKQKISPNLITLQIASGTKRDPEVKWVPRQVWMECLHFLTVNKVLINRPYGVLTYSYTSRRNLGRILNNYCVIIQFFLTKSCKWLYYLS